MNRVVSRIGITPVGSAKYRVNRLRLHLLAYSIARQAQLRGDLGEFIVRCDNTDTERSNNEFLDSYLNTLQSLGVRTNLDPSTKDRQGNSLFQAERGALYKHFLNELEKQGLLLKDGSGAVFFDTERFSEIYAHKLHGFSLTANDASRGMLNLDIRSQVRDEHNHSSLELSPFPIVRANGSFLFHFTSPVDDGLLEVTHVVRHNEKLDMLPKQEMIRTALGFPELTFVHTSLMVDREGKRFTSDPIWGDSTFEDFVARGILPRGLVSYLLSGFSGNSEHFYGSIDEFAASLRLEKIHKSPTAFSPEILRKHNKQAIKIAEKGEYLEGVRTFLSAQKGEQPLILKDDSPMSELLYKTRREIPEAARIYEDHTNLDYGPVPPEFESALALILALHPEIKSENHEAAVAFYAGRAKEHAQQLGVSMAEYCGALSYALLGKISSIGLEHTVRYIEHTLSVTSRLESARSRRL